MMMFMLEEETEQVKHGLRIFPFSEAVQLQNQVVVIHRGVH